MAVPAIIAILYLTFRDARRARTGYKAPPKPVVPPAAKAKARPWLWMVLVLIVAVITFVTRPHGKGRGPARPADPQEILVWTIALPLGLFVVLVLFAYLKARDPLVSRAMRRSREGDREGAIELLREGIEGGRATAIRLNNLGCLYSETRDYDAALKYYSDAEKLEGRQPVFLLNQADALRRLGRPTEAAALLEEVQGQGFIEFFHAYHSCLILADLGQIEEARAQLRRAERVRLPRFLSRSNREAREKVILECRDRLEGMPRDMTRDGDLTV